MVTVAMVTMEDNSMDKLIKKLVEIAVTRGYAKATEFDLAPLKSNVIMLITNEIMDIFGNNHQVKSAFLQAFEEREARHRHGKRMGKIVEEMSTIENFVHKMSATIEAVCDPLLEAHGSKPEEPKQESWRDRAIRDPLL